MVVFVKAHGWKELSYSWGKGLACVQKRDCLPEWLGYGKVDLPSIEKWIFKIDSPFRSQK